MKISRTAVVGPLASALCVLRGLIFLGRPGLRRYIWLPLLVNLLLYALGFWVAAHYFSTVMHWLLPAWLDWLRWLLWPLMAVSLFVIAFFTFTLVANLIGAPFYDRLAEQVQRRLLGQVADAEDKDRSRSQSMAASLRSEMSRMTYFAVRSVPILLLFLIPGLNLIAPFLWLLFGAWSLSLEYMSYPFEAHGIGFGAQRQILKKRRLEALAFGGAVMLGLAIPVLNVFMPPAAVIGAVLYFADKEFA